MSPSYLHCEEQNKGGLATGLQASTGAAYTLPLPRCPGDRRGLGLGQRPDLSLGYAFGHLSASMCSAGTLVLRSEPIVWPLRPFLGETSFQLGRNKV